MFPGVMFVRRYIVENVGSVNIYLSTAPKRTAMQKYDWRTDYCAKDGFTRLTCANCNMAINVQTTCTLKEMRDGWCKRCRYKRRDTIIAKAFEKYDKLKEKPRKLMLWTLGTSMIDTEENQNELRRFWKLFIRRIAHKLKWNAWLRVFEAGSKGNRLHVHFITPDYHNHEKILESWRKVTGEQSNVNYSNSRRRASPSQAFGYVAKYASKGFSYYWMGDLTKVYFDKYRSAHDYRYQFTFDYGYHSMSQTTFSGSVEIYTDTPCGLDT